MKPPAPALFAVARYVDLKENTFTKGGVENTLVRGGRGERGGGGHTPNKPLNMSQMDTQTRQKKNLKSYSFFFCDEYVLALPVARSQWPSKF